MQEREEVTSSEYLHHDVDRVLVFEDVIEFYNVWMLTNFEHFYFSFEQL